MLLMTIARPNVICIVVISLMVMQWGSVGCDIGALAKALTLGSGELSYRGVYRDGCATDRLPNRCLSTLD